MALFATILLGACFVGGRAQFNCATYVSTCSATTNYMAYGNCAATIAVNNATAMACRITHLDLAAGPGATDAAIHCPHAGPNSAAPCDNEVLQDFDCATYVSTCSGTTPQHSNSYANCDSTVAVNGDNNMACRIQHLSLAGGAGAEDAATHCPHAAPDAAAPCNTEIMTGFDCALYVSTCSGVSGYSAYTDCSGTVAANGADGMACRIQHLAAAVSDAAIHCPHAAQAATAPCATEILLPPTTTTIAATPATSGAVRNIPALQALLGVFLSVSFALLF